ncbi:hypothetical protein, partial [Mycoplasma sp. Z386]
KLICVFIMVIASSFERSKFHNDFVWKSYKINYNTFYKNSKYFIWLFFDNWIRITKNVDYN